MERLAIWGASGHALVVADIVRLDGRYEIVSFIEDESLSTNKTFGGSVIVGGREQLDTLRLAGVSKLIVAIGNCATRMSLAEIATQKGFDLVTAVHPGAIVAAGTSVGAGTVIAAGAVVNPGAIIGNNVIVNTLASVDHECVIGSGAHIGPGCHLGGRVKVGRGAWLGIGATVRDRVVIGDRTFVGAGAVVVKDLPDDVVAFGVPAKIQRRAE